MSFFDPEQEDKLKEECGVFGIYNPDGSAAAPSIYYGFLLCSTADRKPAVLPSVTQMARKEISPGTKTWGLSARCFMKNPWIP